MTSHNPMGLSISAFFGSKANLTSLHCPGALPSTSILLRRWESGVRAAGGSCLSMRLSHPLAPGAFSGKLWSLVRRVSSERRGRCWASATALWRITAIGATGVGWLPQISWLGFLTPPKGQKQPEIDQYCCRRATRLCTGPACLHKAFLGLWGRSGLQFPAMPAFGTSTAQHPGTSRDNETNPSPKPQPLALLRASAPASGPGFVSLGLRVARSLSCWGLARRRTVLVRRFLAPALRSLIKGLKKSLSVSFQLIDGLHLLDQSLCCFRQGLRCIIDLTAELQG